MASVFCVGVFLAGVLITLFRGPLAAFCWVYFPVVIAVPGAAQLELSGLPEFSAARLTIVGIIAAAMVAGRGRELTPRWHMLDLLPAAMALSFSISFGIRTDVMGFVHKIVKYGFDWAAPYILARALFRDVRSLRMLMGPLVILTSVLGLAAGYEMRMVARPVENFWLAIGVPAPVVMNFHEHWRMNMLRAHIHLGHPLTMGALFTAMAPFVLLRSIILRQKLLHAGCILAAVLGVFASLSRGPIAVLFFTAIVFWLAKLSPKTLLTVGVAAVVVLAIPAANLFQQLAAETQKGLEEFGNVDSDDYRIALLILYGSRLTEFGLLGRPDLIAAEYAATWSIDNSYLYQFIFGGMLGGGMFLVFTVGVLILGYRKILKSSGYSRIIACCINASFFGLALALANVWFAEDIYLLFWITSALVVNLQMTPLLARDTAPLAIARPAEATWGLPTLAHARSILEPAPSGRRMGALRPGPSRRLRARDGARAGGSRLT